MPWQVRKTDVEFFVEELWKDRRPFPVAKSPDDFAKDCFDYPLALIEASVLLVLRERLGEQVVPVPRRIESGKVLILERIKGARLFDLLRHLSWIGEVAPDSGADEIRKMLLGRARERLRKIQLELAQLSPLYCHEPYPLKRKLTSLLDLFLRVLAVQNVPESWRNSLEQFVDYWDSDCASIPFRDATTKNMIVAHPDLTLDCGKDSEATQRAAVRTLLEGAPKEIWETIPIVDIDFSSVVHLTSIEDDPISLNCHQWTFGSEPIEPASFVLDPMLGRPDPMRAASTLFVRYLRFGGRKLAYFLINPQGFKMRFAYDDPLFYFEKLPALCGALSPDFERTYPDLIAIVNSIYRAARNPSRADRELLEVDHLRRYRQEPTHYWQQSPLEGHP
jgi:hypothetical protein